MPESMTSASPSAVVAVVVVVVVVVVATVLDHFVNTLIRDDHSCSFVCNVENAAQNCCSAFFPRRQILVAGASF